MTAAQRAKQLGAHDLKWVAEYGGYNYRHLFDMYRDNPRKFDIIVAGCVSLDKGAELKARILEVLDSM